MCPALFWVQEATLRFTAIAFGEYITDADLRQRNLDDADGEEIFLSKGRHTTTSRQLIRLDNGAMIIDTPGMRELGSIAVDDGLVDTFSEIAALSRNCKFSYCSHTGEKGCAILAAIKAGDLSEQRYQNYLKMKKESEFNQMSYVEKRKKDRNFSKLVKTTMKNKKRQYT